jgi:predicted flap endonuclease-1-like 5' DNA nuclease
MSNREDKHRLIDQIWLQAALVFLTIFIFWWIRQRRQEPQVADRPVIWRRDIEMGPTIIPQTAVEESTVVMEAPEVQMGAGQAVEETADLQNRQEQVPSTSSPAEVQGPPPLSEELPSETPASDDLEIIEGIGPKISRILQDAGIRTFVQLSDTDVPRLEEILRAASIRLANPETWAEQARLAAAGEWNKLETLQGQLKRGRRV